MSGLTRVSLSIEEPLLEKLDAMAEESGYQNRSEFVRDLIREQMIHAEWQTGKDVLGTLTVIYCHHQRGLTEKLVMLQHHWGGHVLAATHVHLSHEICAEMIMVQGPGEAVSGLANAIKRERGVLHVSLGMGSTGEHIA